MCAHISYDQWIKRLATEPEPEPEPEPQPEPERVLVTA